MEGENTFYDAIGVTLASFFTMAATVATAPVSFCQRHYQFSRLSSCHYAADISLRAGREKKARRGGGVVFTPHYVITADINASTGHLLSHTIQYRHTCSIHWPCLERRRQYIREGIYNVTLPYETQQSPHYHIRQVTGLSSAPTKVGYHAVSFQQ